MIDTGQELFGECDILSATKAIPSKQRIVPMWMQAYLRFGKWEEMINYPFPENTGIALYEAMWYYGQAFASASSDDCARAREMSTEFASYLNDEELTSYLKSNGVYPTIALADLTLKARMADKCDGDLETAAAKWGDAITYNDNLPYKEPPYWPQSLRVCLGEVLLRSEDRSDWALAIGAFYDDLHFHPSNGWALFGLKEAYTQLGDKWDADTWGNAFESAWQCKSNPHQQHHHPHPEP